MILDAILVAVFAVVLLGVPSLMAWGLVVFFRQRAMRKRLRQFRPLVSATIEPRDIVEMMRQNDEERGNAA